MSNDKQSMSLYTEEQVLKMLEVCRDTDLYEHILTFEDILKTVTPIELPSDEELKKQFDIDKFDPYDLAYLGGAIRMRNLIQGGNK